MAGADIGGDSSVQWHVWGDNVRPGKEVLKNRGAHGREHGHIDETDPGGTFKISIEVPPGAADAGVFLTSFGQACSNAQNAAPGSRLNFELPIVGHHPDQIQIRWDSSQSFGRSAMTSMASMTTGGAKKKKKTAKKAARKQAKKKAAKKKR